MKRNKIILSLITMAFVNFNVMQVLACDVSSSRTEKVKTSCSGTSRCNQPNKCGTDWDRYNRCGSDSDRCGSNECRQKSCELTVPNYCKTTAYNTPISGTVVAVDKSKHTLTYTKACDPCHGTVTVNSDGTWTYVPRSGFSGCDSFKVKVSDGRGATAVSTVGITVAKPMPTVPNYNVTTNVDTKVTGKVVGSNFSGCRLCYTVTTSPANGTVKISSCTGAWEYTPKSGFVGDDSFKVTVKDGCCNKAVSTVNITVVKPTSANNAPTIPDYSKTINENEVINDSVKGSDVDTGDTLTYAKASDPSHGSVTVKADGSYTYTPATDYAGTDSFTVIVSDGKGGSATGTVNVTVNSVNHAPTIPDYNKTTDKNVAINDKVVGTDVDGDTLTYVKASGPSNGTVTVNTDGSYVYTPNSDYVGSDSFTVTVSDGKGGSATGTVNITVNSVAPVNHAPVVSDYNETTTTATLLSDKVVATDLDGDTLTYTVTTSPANGTVKIDSATGIWKYKSKTGFSGEDSFIVTVSDGKGGTAVSTIKITVNPASSGL
ncbi:Ig-like domain-containing protein [Clostridium magnum]|uniref:Cadherin domain-containing protein n=1 Tax=Clostridium magnum DSM 2767 TaxID=1121326 RepID=A0A161X1R7_9CLOT|nr:Ig-like domain-containing protein [Clostridium magnum]KZL93408.1 hypothetical protein CLMAG_04320 [Clostridium magnum DSM 2767]SHI15769.1 VCBS repeat-containing protein [Clostridium magnum DSM 2767]